MGGTVRVLVACEFSGIVRDAFRKRGHYAVSCDLEPSQAPGPHIVGDVRDVLRGAVVTVTDGADTRAYRFSVQDWDLMIAHPPCTYLCNSGVRWLYLGGRKRNGIDQSRWDAMYEAVRFFIFLEKCGVRRIAIENPRPHVHALPYIGQSTQFIHPFQFGHPETKETHLWLHNLPKLEPTNVVEATERRIHSMGPSPDRGKLRSIFYTGIAEAMAEQWGGLE